MKGYTFYLEYETPALKRKGTVKNPGPHLGNVIAVIHDCPANPGNYAAYSSVYSTPNSPVNFGEVSLDYLRYNCRRIPEQMAREIHPRLFDRIEEDIEREENEREQNIEATLEWIRKSILDENVSYSQIAELQSLKKYIPADDTLLLQWAGVPERTL